MRTHIRPGQKASPCSTSMQASLRFAQPRRQPGLIRSLKEGGNGPARPNDDGVSHRTRQVATQLRGLKEGNTSDDENGASTRSSDQDPFKSDLSWSDLDKEQKNNWLRKAFIKVDNTRTVFSTIPTSENQPERLVQLFEEPATRQRFVKRCLIPTGTACILGCVAYAMRLELGFPGLSVLGHNLVAGLLGFLMAFITSTNYNRWLQARSGLCNITIMCVDIASRADVFITTKDEDGIRARREMARYLRLLYTSIILTLTDSSLWGGSSQDTKATAETSKQLRRIMMEDASPSERRLLLGGGPRDLPFLVIELIRQHINKDTTLKSFVHNTFGSQFIAITCQDNLKGKVDELFPAIGTVLSLALTPLPMGFRTIYSTILNVLVYTFPFALVSEITWETPIVSSFLAFGYYGVYSMSQELMLPFRPRAQATGNDGKSYKPGLFSCNADWVRVMNDEFNRILIKKTA